MSKLNYMLLVGLASLAVDAGAQTVYTVTENMSLLGPDGPTMLTTIYRDGDHAVMDQSHGPDKDNPQGYHVRIYNDLAAHTSYSWDVIHTESGCGTGKFSGDWGDPFVMSGSAKDELTKAGAKEGGTETVNGFAAKVLTVTVEGTAVKAWVDTKSGMLIKEQMMPASGPPAVLIDVKQVSLAAPPSAMFALPASCKELAAGPKAPAEDEQIAAETGGHAGDYVRAIAPADGVSTKGCSVVVRMVKAVTMEPITSGFQLAVDLTYDVNHPPNYVRGTGANGKETVSGGGIRDVTAQMQNGAYRIANPSAYFNLESYWGNAGDAFALIYTQCFGPQSVLLFVVKDPSNVGKGGDWLWAKSGKFAGK
jgi:hypothetical protein